MIRFVLIFLFTLTCYANPLFKMKDLWNTNFFKSDRLKLEIAVGAMEYGLDPLIMIAQAYAESSFNPKAINLTERNYPSRGLFQIQFPTAWQQCKLSKRQLMNPLWNIRCAFIVHNNSREDFEGDEFEVIKMLFAYNAGGYYICNKRHHRKGIDCQLGYPVNYDYLIKIIDHYVRLQPSFNRLRLTQFKSVNFLDLAQKYVDSLQ